MAEISGGFVYSGASQVKAEPMVMRLALTEDTAKTEQTKETNSNLIKILGQGNEGKYTVITSTGLIDSVKLKTVLNDFNGTDTDLDGLIDWNEVNVDIVNRHLKNEGKQELKTVRNSDLPLFSDLILHSSEWGSFKPYLWTETDFARYAYANCFDNVRILPIKSDPTKVDSDGDYFLDSVNNDLNLSDEYEDETDPNPLYAFTDTSKNYGFNSANIFVKKTKKDRSEFYIRKTIELNKYIKYKAIRDNVSGITSGENEAVVGKYKFSYEVQEYLQSCCDTVINRYIENDYNEETIAYLKKYLTPELIMAVGTTESGWKETTPNKTGHTIGGVAVYKNCIGGSNAYNTIESYYGVMSGASGTAVALGNFMKEQINGGWSNVYNNTRTSSGKLKEDQVLYNTLYAYGSGRTLDGYSWTESAMSSAYKVYSFANIYYTRHGIWIIDFSEKQLCKYTNNEWDFSLNIKDYLELKNVTLTGDYDNGKE